MMMDVFFFSNQAHYAKKRIRQSCRWTRQSQCARASAGVAKADTRPRTTGRLRKPILTAFTLGGQCEMKEELPLERMCISDSVSNLGDTEKAKE
jgi:hypothetical protein